MSFNYGHCEGTDLTAEGFDNLEVLEGFCTHWYDQPGGKIRDMHVTSEGDVLVLKRAGSEVLALHDDDINEVVDSRTILASYSGINHGVVVHKGYLYASSDTVVVRWPYTAGQRTTSPSSDAKVVVYNIDPAGHSTRTIIFDQSDRLYVQVGSRGNLDANSDRSRIRRFTIPTTNSDIPDGGYDYQTGEVFVDGVRNEVGLVFDEDGVLWGVENGSDNLHRSDLGGDIHNDNPAEELNRFPESSAGQHWGYPYCWTEVNIPASSGGLGRGTVWAYEETRGDGTHTDAWCRSNSIAPAHTLQAHSAPLGMMFYRYNDSSISPTARASLCPNYPRGAFPESMDGDLFVGYHGSWNRDPATGFKVVRVPFNSTTKLPVNPNVDDPIDILRHSVLPAAIRPVDVKFDACGRLLVSSDGTYSGVLMVSYSGDGANFIANNGTSSGSQASGNYFESTEGLLTLVVVCVFCFCGIVAVIAASSYYSTPATGTDTDTGKATAAAGGGSIDAAGTAGATGADVEYQLTAVAEIEDEEFAGSTGTGTGVAAPLAAGEDMIEVQAKVQ